MKTTRLLLFLLVLGLTRLSATVLYDIDFTPPDTGTYHVVFGSPTVQSSVGPFTDALVFHAVSTYDQISLAINSSAPQFDIQYDVFGHNLVNSLYDFSLTLDTPEVRTIDLNGHTNEIYVYQPSAGDTSLLALTNDQVYHFEIFVNLGANLWTVTINGVQKYSHAFGATSLQALRFTMDPSVGGTGDMPGTYAALDNIKVNAIPEPSAFALIASGLAAGLLLRRRGSGYNTPTQGTGSWKRSLMRSLFLCSPRAGLSPTRICGSTAGRYRRCESAH
jgi:hypothetical protein